MADYVYLLSVYDEHGSESVRATLNRRFLPELLVRPWGRWVPSEKYVKRLAEILQSPDTDLAGKDGAMPRDLGDGWGGPQLHVVRLEK